jgi:Phosphopantetheine attachment site.
MHTIKDFVAGLFSECLNIPTVGPRDNFFAMGGQSLAAAVLVTKVERAYGVQVLLGEFMSNACVEDFAQVVETRLRESAQ